MTHKLLLADDSATIQRVVELTFSGEDVQVIAVGDGEEAIARIPVERPDIVLADIGMPKRSGYDVAAFVKTHPDLSHIPVLLLAGAFEPVDQLRAQQVQCDGVLVKPFEPQQVVSRVRQFLDRQVAPSTPPAPAGPVQAKDVPPNASAPRADEYFERLDAALAERERTPTPSASSYGADGWEQGDVPTVDQVLGTRGRPPVESAAAPPAGAWSAGVTGSGHTPGPPSGPNVIADVFAALFAAEQGSSEAAAPSTVVRPPGPPVVSDELVEAVSRRVMERLAPEAAHDLVAEIVTEVAERLVREEIGRIKSAVGTRLEYP